MSAAAHPAPHARHAAHAAAKVITLENGPKNSPVPLHPGAAKFYKEKGLIK